MRSVTRSIRRATNGRPLRSLWSNGTSTERPEWATEPPCYFDAGGRGNAGAFLAAYHDALAAIGEPRHIALPTANHDFARLCAGPRTPEQLPPAFAFLLTFPAFRTPRAASCAPVTTGPGHAPYAMGLKP
jgi:hypothetical protein